MLLGTNKPREQAGFLQILEVKVRSKMKNICGHAK